MKCQADIVSIADSKLNAANILFQNGDYDNAYYLGGYSIELLLKAKVCKTLNIDDFFDVGSSTLKRLKYEGTFKVHDFEQLIILSGIYKDFDAKMSDPSFKADWSIVSKWKEDSRYLTGHNQKDVKDFLT